MLQRIINRTNKSVSYTLPAPIKGLNARDNPADMDAGYALVMDNYIPLDTKVALRKGYVLHNSLTSEIGTLAEYRGETTSVFLAVSGTKAYNVSATGNVYAYDNVTFGNNICRTQQYKNYLYFVNGLDTPKVFYLDGNGEHHFEDWNFIFSDNQSHYITNVSVSKQRLWFVEKNSMKVWYPQTAGNISGALQCFDLAQVARFGGYLVAVANWTQDGGQGIDDLTVFITSEGEALVYSGSNVNNADDWKLRGSYKISRPIGYNCLVPYQGDVVIISEDGYIPLSKALPIEQANSSQVSFSDAIRGLVLSRTAKYADYNGWQGIIYGRGGYAIFNVPVASGFEQHVININTGAWCRFTGINACCWSEFEKRMYFCDGRDIFLFDEGYSDNGTRISGTVEQAYSNLGSNSLKQIQLINPRTKFSSGYSLVIYTNMDMEKRNIDYEENVGFVGITKWNKKKWSSSALSVGTKWSSLGSTMVQSQWIANSSTGYKASIVFKTKTKGNAIEWYDTILRFQLGSGVM